MSKNRKENKGFRPETIARIIAALMILVNLYTEALKAGQKIALVISTGNRKIGRCMNVSLAPILCCGNCKECKRFCYDVKACCQYENVRKARAKNTALFRFSRDEFFSQLWDKMSRRRTNKYLRFHVSGEIVDIDHFNRIVETARRFPDFRIWTYTKMYHVVNAWIKENGPLPENLVCMFSYWKGLPMDNPYNMPVFRCAQDETEKIGFHCPGNCDFCKEHKCGCIYGNSSWVDLH